MFARRGSSWLPLFFLLPVVYVAGSTTGTSAPTTTAHVATAVATSTHQFAFTTAAPLPRGGDGGISEGDGTGNCPIGGNYIPSEFTPNPYCWYRDDYANVPWPYKDISEDQWKAGHPNTIVDSTLATPFRTPVPPPPAKSPPPPPTSKSQPSSTAPACPRPSASKRDERDELYARAEKRPSTPGVTKPRPAKSPNLGKGPDREEALCKGKGKDPKKRQDALVLRTPNYGDYCRQPKTKGTISYKYKEVDSKSLIGEIRDAGNEWNPGGRQGSNPKDDAGQCDHYVELQWFKFQLTGLVKATESSCTGDVDVWEDVCTILRKDENRQILLDILNKAQNLHGVPLTINQLKKRMTGLILQTRFLGQPLPILKWSFDKEEPQFNFAKSWLGLAYYLELHQKEAKATAGELEAAVAKLFAGTYIQQPSGWADQLDKDWYNMRNTIHAQEPYVMAAVEKNCGENPNVPNNNHQKDADGCCGDQTRAAQDKSAPPLFTELQAQQQIPEDQCCSPSEYCCKGAQKSSAPSSRRRDEMLRRPAFAGNRRQDRSCKREDEEEEDDKKHNNDKPVTVNPAVVAAGASAVYPLAAAFGVGLASVSLLENNKSTKAEVQEAVGPKLVDLVNNEFKQFATDPKNHTEAVKIIDGPSKDAYDLSPADSDEDPYAVVISDEGSMYPDGSVFIEKKTTCEWIRDALETMLVAANLKTSFLPACPK